MPLKVLVRFLDSLHAMLLAGTRGQTAGSRCHNESVGVAR